MLLIPIPLEPVAPVSPLAPSETLTRLISSDTPFTVHLIVTCLTAVEPEPQIVVLLCDTS